MDTTNTIESDATSSRSGIETDSSVARPAWRPDLSASRPRKLAGRGQTLQDYALGIGVFLLILFFVLNTVVPSMLAPFETDAGGDVEAQAERVANTFVENATRSGQLNELDIGTVHELAGKDQSALQTRYRLPDTSQINITIETLNGSSIVESVAGTRLRAGATLPGTESATRSRIITLSDDACAPACRLVVRGW